MKCIICVTTDIYIELTKIVVGDVSSNTIQFYGISLIDNHSEKKNQKYIRYFKNISE